MSQQDLNFPIFEKLDVVLATGIKPATLAMWIERGIVRPTLENPGPGTPRKFSLNGIKWIATVARLADFMSPSHASEIVETVRKSSRSDDPRCAEVKWIFVWKNPANGRYQSSWSVKDKIEDIWNPQIWHSPNSGVYVVINVGEIASSVMRILDDGEAGELIPE